jgi:hypothetical protein
MIFITEYSGSIPLLGGVVQGPSFCEAGYVVLDLWIEPLSKLQGNVGSLKYRVLDEFMEVINVFVNISAALEEPQSFEFGPRSLDFVLGAEVDNAFVYEFPP